jgi:alkylation response protein AidB-like acyl-CoA dehydrogenase
MTHPMDRRESAMLARREEYVARASALAPGIEADAEEIERERRLPRALVSRLVDAGLFRMLLPASLGGGEVDPATFVSVIEEIAKADASTAWCLCQASGCSMSAAYLPPAAAWEVFGSDPGAILAWGPGPDARAVAADGGYRVSGTWSFASGCRHATWLGGYCPIREPDGTPRRRAAGGVEGRTMLFPAAEATFVDTWHVGGLRGTASDTFTVSDLFVPRERAILRDDPAERQEVGPLYCFPIGSLYASGFSGVALGVARRTLDALVDLAYDKTPRGMKQTLRHDAVVQSHVAQGEAQLASARLFLLESLDEIWRAVRETGGITLAQRMRIRLAATYGIQQAKQVVDAAHQAAGGTAIFSSGPFDRRFRDIHAVTQQVQGRLAHFENVGRFLLGLEPDTTFL